MRSTALIVTLAVFIGAASSTLLLHQDVDAEQTNAVVQLAQRLLGADAKRFQFKVVPDNVLPRHYAELTSSGQNELTIQANSGVAAAWALHHYLTQQCSCMVTWSGAQLSLPAGRLPPLVGGRMLLVAPDRYTAMPNVCTFSYTYAWWNFSRWERHIDWMALHGVNLAYALTGQEQVFRNVFIKMGMAAAEVDNYFAGPAFLAWSRMGNLKKWGGPLPPGWYAKQTALQKQILARMLSLGMTPVLQGFSGMVPDAFIRVFPRVNYTRLSNWNNFGRNYSETVVVDPEDPIFVNISTMIVKESMNLFGDVTDFYAMDTFNENRPEKGDLAYISAVSKAILRGLRNAEPNGVWLLQSWFFGNDAGFWTIDRVRAMLSPIPKGQLLIMDLYGDSRGSLAPKLNGYFGHDFIWTLLHDFGGNNAMFGGIAGYNQRGPWAMRRLYPNGMAGVGITPEGLMQNEFVYEFAMEFSWRSEPVSELYWAERFARRRYGVENQQLAAAWTELQGSIYNSAQSEVSSPLLIHRPSLSDGESVYYDPKQVEAAWRKLLSVNSTGNYLLTYDQVDLTREMLQIRFEQFYQQLRQHAAKNDSSGVRSAATTMESLLQAMEWLLQTDSHFLLQKMINDAKAFATSASEEPLYEFNVRNQLTAWGPGPYNIPDYSARMYSGLIKEYFLPRWQLFFEQLLEAMYKGRKFDEGKFTQLVFDTVEKPFFSSNLPVGPAAPRGDAYAAARMIVGWLPPAPASVAEETAAVANDAEGDGAVARAVAEALGVL